MHSRLNLYQREFRGWRGYGGELWEERVSVTCGKKWGGHGRQLNSAKPFVLRDHYRSLRITFCLICQESKHYH